jgi:hypothetical protein
LTGKIRCSICGFVFQGHTTKSKGIVYRRYIDGGWSAKLVCDFYGINKEKIEGFAISAVQEIVNDNQIFGRLEAALQQKISEESRQSLSKNQNLLSLHEQLAGRRSNIMAAISRTSNPRLVNSLLLKLEDIDQQIDSTEKELLIEKSNNEERCDIKTLFKDLMEFCLNFDVRFSEATISEKKVLLQKCLSEIIIDRDRKVAVVRVREIPAIHPDVANLLQNKKAHTEVVCARGSGGRT